MTKEEGSHARRLASLSPVSHAPCLCCYLLFGVQGLDKKKASAIALTRR